MRIRSILETSLGIWGIEQKPSLEGCQKEMDLVRKGLQLLAEPM